MLKKRGLFVVISLFLIFILIVVFGSSKQKNEMQAREVASTIDLEDKSIKVINFFGDSITEQGKFIDTVLKNTGASESINNGDSGTSYAKANKSNEWDWESPDRNYTRSFVDRISKANLDGDVIVLFGGTNDYGKGVEIGNKESTDATTFFGAVKETITIAKTRNKEAEIIIVTPLQRDQLNGTRGIEENKAGHSLEDYSNALKVIAKDENLPVVDLFNSDIISINKKGENSDVLTNTEDGLHPNKNGGIKIGQEISKTITSLE